MRRPTFAILGFLIGGIGAAPALAVPSLDAYALSAAGRSSLGAAGPPFSCATFGPDPAAAIFGGGFGVGLPTDGSPCGVGVDARSVTAAAGQVQVASSLAVGFGPPIDPHTFVGTAAGRAAFGHLGVSAAGSYTGSSDGFTLAGSQAGARQIETMTFGGASGAGVYRPTFTIDGSLFSVGRTDSEIEFGYAAGAGPRYMSFRIQNNRGSFSFYANGGYQASLPGMTVTGDLVNGVTVAGSTTFSMDIPIVFGVALDVNFQMWAATLPASNVNLLTASAGNVSFLSSAKLTGIQVLNASGQALNAFSISAGSGTLYGPGGVTAVPEPGSSLLMTAGLLTLLWVRARARPVSA